MCTIDKMLIKGIRSFSPDNTAVIEFYKPLTLIVGHNGAGKTTIIECLKQACTGELPPNTRSGQSFIHDPKVAGESEIKAQIKLRFVTAGGQPMVIVRSFQLIQKKLQLQYKALDQVLQTHNKDTGQKEAISYRCGDMDRIVPNLMGVSKAIMENVIFVHQEESNWPLSEGATLKKKFDDIFSATKYTKALDAFRKLRLETAQEVKEFKLKLEHLRTLKENAHKLRAEVEQGRQREQELEAQIQGLEDQLQQHKQEMAELDSKIQQCQDFQEALSMLQTRHDITVSRNATRQVQLVAAYGAQELEVGLEELEQWQADLEPRLAETAALIDRLGYDIRAAESKAEALKQQHANEIKKEAMLSAEADVHKRNMVERDYWLRAASQKFGVGQLPPLEGPLPAEATKDFLAAFAQKVADYEKEVQQLHSKNQQQDDEDSQLLDQVTAQITDATQKAKIKRQTLQDNEARIARLQHQVEASLVSLVMAQDAEDAEKAAQTRLKAKQDALNGSGFGESLAKIATELEGVQKKTSALRQERDKLAVTADDGARLQLMRKERNQKQTQLDMLVNNRRQRLTALIACVSTGIPEADKLKAVVEHVLRKHEQELSKKASELQKMQGQASTTQGALTACQTQLNQQQHEVDTLQNSVQASLSQIYNVASVQQPLAGCIHDAEKEFITCKSKLERIKGLEINYQQFIATAHRDNVCQICKRGFHGPEESQQFIQMQFPAPLKAEAAALLPDHKNMLEAQIQSAEGRLKALRALHPNDARLDSLRSTEMAATAERLKQLDAKATAEAAAVADLHNDHKAVQQKLQEGQQLMKDVVWQVDRLAGEVSSSTREITRLENQTKVAGSTRTVADVDADLEALEAARSQHERSKDEVLRKQGRLRDEISHLQTVWQAAREEAMNMRNAADKREALEREIAAAQASNVQLEHEATACAESVEPLKARREQRAQERQQRRSAAREREEEQEYRWRDLHTQQRQMQGHCRTVSSYEQAGKAERLLDTQRALELTSKAQQDQDALLKDLERQLRQAEKEQMGDADSKRQIEDQLDHQRNLRAEARLKAEIQQVQAQIGDVGNIREIHHRFTELRQICTDLQRTQNMAQGSLGTVQEGMQRAQRDLGGVNYRDIDNRYSTQLLEVQTNEMGISDVEKYHKATEKALLDFHTNKMADINKCVKELWQRTYRNQDIDYIQIRADADGTRSYNYRVVMMAGGAELEMRGRCSAGQKVLACLIIRLALAECFCINCGILALDEPTTNLDAANSASLAEALRNVMDTRKAQTNFQLVVITHDERFAQMVATREHAEYKFRITKDENQHSHVEKEELAI